MDIFFKTISGLAADFESSNITYQYTGAASLWIQGVGIPGPESIDIVIQWDVLEKAYEMFKENGLSEIDKTPAKAVFSFMKNGWQIRVSCYYNTTVKTDPYRIAARLDGVEVWCRSLYSYMYDSELKRYEQAIQTYLLQQQRSFSAHNEKAWNQNNYTALVNRYGEPAETARKIEQNPEWRLHPFYKYMGDVKGKNIVHLMGSNGIKAVALGLLGGIVTVVDFSAENAAYAQETSKEAGVSIEYVISDTLSIPAETADGQFDIAFMELGVLHYYIDLHPLWEMVGRLLKQGGMFILHEFHPVSTKLITSTGKKHKVTGNYFNPGIEKSTIAFSKHLSNEEQETLAMSLHRKWTLGEVLTSMARSGLTISVLEEEPNHKGHDIGLPKTYTVVAYK